MAASDYNDVDATLFIARNLAVFDWGRVDLANTAKQRIWSLWEGNSILHERCSRWKKSKIPATSGANLPTPQTARRQCK